MWQRVFERSDKFLKKYSNFKVGVSNTFCFEGHIGSKFDRTKYLLREHNKCLQASLRIFKGCMLPAGRTLPRPALKCLFTCLRHILPVTCHILYTNQLNHETHQQYSVSCREFKGEICPADENNCSLLCYTGLHKFTMECRT